MIMEDNEDILREEAWEKTQQEWAEHQNKMLNLYAFPGRQMALIGDNEEEVATQGITKREYFAGLAMQGMFANPSIDVTVIDEDKITQWSVNAADSILKKLSQ